jgi:hypothetical protein
MQRVKYLGEGLSLQSLRFNARGFHVELVVEEMGLEQLGAKTK